MDWETFTYILHRGNKQLEHQLRTVEHNHAPTDPEVLGCPGTQAVFHLLRNPEADRNADLSFQLMLEQCGDDKELRKLLTQYRDVFKDKLPEKLPPDRGLVHEINTGDNRPINIQAYQLSSSQLAEQTKQITDLLEKGLIRESSSSWG